MLIDEPKSRALLWGVVHRATADASLYEELMQEGMIHLWQKETRHPGHTRSWYLESCKFKLRAYLELGHSVDSLKHRQCGCQLNDESGSADADSYRLDPEESFLPSRMER